MSACMDFVPYLFIVFVESVIFDPARGGPLSVPPVTVPGAT